MHSLIPPPSCALRSCGAALLLAVLCGCGTGQKTAAPVDPDVARRTLDAVLLDWKNGGTPDAWQQKSPKVVVQDLDWAAGAKLVSYEVLGPGEVRDANLYCQVKIVAASQSQKETPRTVTYVVGTDPVITVFRDLLH